MGNGARKGGKTIDIYVIDLLRDQSSWIQRYRIQKRTASEIV